MVVRMVWYFYNRMVLGPCAVLLVLNYCGVLNSA